MNYYYGNNFPNYDNYSYSNYNSNNDYIYDKKQEFKRKLKRKRIIRHNIRVVFTLLVIASIILFLAGRFLKTFLDKIDNNDNTSSVMSYNIKTSDNKDFKFGQDDDYDSYSSYNNDSYNNDTYDITNVSYNPDEIPAQLIEFMERRPETTDFVMSYPEKHDVSYYIDLSKEVTAGEIPLFIQWDERWGYKQYGDDFFALNGCGPTCLSMVCLGLGGDTKYDPYTVGTLMDANGYYEAGSGSKWSIMTEGASLIGLYGEEISLDENVIRNTLNSGSPIICSVGEGDFTQSGHFIVLAGIAQAGSVIVNDPCSRINSEQTWELSRIMPQIKNLWAFSLN